MGKLQIGVMGSAADLNYTKEIEQLAEEVGRCVAEAGAVLMFGAEKDYDSLSTAACRGAKKAGGLTCGVTYGKGSSIFDWASADVIIASGLERGGGREFVLVLSCDAIICISGGSGTLTEMVIAYQANIPIVVLKRTGGWSQKLEGEYLDARKRVKIEVAKTPETAVKKAILLFKKKQIENYVPAGSDSLEFKLRETRKVEEGLEGLETSEEFYGNWEHAGWPYEECDKDDRVAGGEW